MRENADVHAGAETYGYERTWVGVGHKEDVNPGISKTVTCRERIPDMFKKSKRRYGRMEGSEN